MTRAEAIDEITTCRLDFGRESLSQTAWDAIKESNVVALFNKERLMNSLRGNVRGFSLTSRLGRRTVPSLRTFQDLLKTDKINVVSGMDDEGKSVRFGYMTAQMKSLLKGVLGQIA